MHAPGDTIIMHLEMEKVIFCLAWTVLKGHLQIVEAFLPCFRIIGLLNGRGPDSVTLLAGAGEFKEWVVTTSQRTLMQNAEPFKQMVDISGPLHSLWQFICRD